MELEPNVCLDADSYKETHWPQYPEGTEGVFSYLECRGSGDPKIIEEGGEAVFFGLQAELDALAGEVVTDDAIAEAIGLLPQHFGTDSFFNEGGWRHVIQDHGRKLPVVIRALPEGMPVPLRNAMLTVENTCPRCAWLTNLLETRILRSVWFPTTVATLSREFRRMQGSHYLASGLGLDDPQLDFGLLDFGARGVSALGAARIGGGAHLVIGRGTDTLEALRWVRHHYGHPCAGYSAAAYEHSTVTSWGRDGELACYRNALAKYPTGILSIVIDSYDSFAAAKMFCTELREEVLARDGKLVLRTDSGVPYEVCSKLLQILWEGFPEGRTLTSTGHRRLSPMVGLLQSEGVDLVAADDLLRELVFDGWAACDPFFGMGGGLLQKVNRDTLKFAVKCSAAKVGGVWRDVYKDPATMRSKGSKRGRLKVVRGEGGSLLTVREGQPGADLLEEVFRDGVVTRRHTFSEIRGRAAL